MLLFKSKEEKLFNEIDKLKGPTNFNKEIYDAFFKYERPRQTWSYSKNEVKTGNLLDKINKGKSIDDDDLKKVNEVIEGSVGKNDRYLMPYINSLEMIRKMDKALTSDDIGSKEKNEYQRQKEQCCEDITEFLYGDNNFIQKLGKDYFKDHHKTLFNLLSICDTKKYEDMLNSMLTENSLFRKKLNVEILSNHKGALTVLAGALDELFGTKNKYHEKLQKMCDVYESAMSTQF